MHLDQQCCRLSFSILAIKGWEPIPPHPVTGWGLLGWGGMVPPPQVKLEPAQDVFQWSGLLKHVVHHCCLLPSNRRLLTSNRHL